MIVKPALLELIDKIERPFLEMRASWCAITTGRSWPTSIEDEPGQRSAAKLPTRDEADRSEYRQAARTAKKGRLGFGCGFVEEYLPRKNTS